jgi:BirA family transcriptional regulator, biotin operon repressor / biotin---[acetyl-CoA-carboxylase] ligase
LFSIITVKTLEKLPPPPSSISDTPDRTDLPDWLHWVETCESTNTWAIANATALTHGDVVFTTNQTAGRGQHGRSWYAPPGVLTASVILDGLPVSQLPGLSLAAGLAVIYAVEDLLPNLQDELRLKWPNDVWRQERKLAGILCEATSGSKGHSRVVVGIGLNRCADFSNTNLNNAISLHQVSITVPDELSLLERSRHYLLQASSILSCKDLRADDGSELSGLAALLPELRRRDGLLGRPITIESTEGRFTGQAAGLDASGRLLLRLPNARLQAFTSGRVVWRSEDTQYH